MSGSSAMQSALYFGTVQHRRFAPVARTFRYRLYMSWLDLDELDAFFGRRWLWSLERFNVASFRRRDYLGPAHRPLADCVRDEVAEATGARPEGPVRMLTHLRTFGYVFNPVTFYWAWNADGGQPVAVLAEITNTPWKERHRYVLPLEGGRIAEHEFTKAFHISPFFGMDQGYRWSFREPGERIAIHMENREAGERVFDASLALERREASAWNCARALLRHPAMAAVGHAAIYWQALRLKLRGVPYHPHPQQASAQESPSQHNEHVA